MVHPFASIPSLRQKKTKAEVEEREGPFIFFLSLFPHLPSGLEKNYSGVVISYYLHRHFITK